MISTLYSLSNQGRKMVIQWWRPWCCIGFVATIWTQGVVLPIVDHSAPDLMGLAALVTAVVAAFAVREWGKQKGSAQ